MSMSMKEHPWLVTTTIQGDGVTIKYDVTKPNRSDAVRKAYRINAEGKGELVGDGEEFDGLVLDVNDKDQFTAAYMFGGLRMPLAEGETVSRGDKLVGGLGPGSAKGYVKSAEDVVRPANNANAAAVLTAVRANAAAAKGKGYVLNFDTENALVAK